MPPCCSKRTTGKTGQRILPPAHRAQGSSAMKQPPAQRRADQRSLIEDDISTIVRTVLDVLPDL